MPEITLENKQKINYFFYRGDSPATIVLLHGLWSNMSIWEKEIGYFKRKNISLLAFDLRCHGMSGCIANPKFSDFSCDLHLLLKKLGISKAILIGHSLGGMISLDFYKKYPKYVSSLVLIDSSYAVSRKTLLPFFRLEYLLIKIVWFFAKHRKDKPVYTDFQKFSKSDDLRILYEANSSLNTDKNHEGIITELLKIDFSSILRKISVPVLIIGDTKDEFFRIEVPKSMAKIIPRSRLCILGGTHSSILKRPIKISHIIEEFIEKNKIAN